MTSPVPRQLPLVDFKTLEPGQLIAGPFATKVLGEFGADMIKVEPLSTGVPLRKWRMVDVTLYESVFSVMESLVPEYDATDHIRGPGGSVLPGITSSNAYRTRNGDFVLIAGNGDSIFKRLMAAIDRPDLSEDPALAHNNGRSLRADELDAASGPGRSSAATTNLAALDAAGVPVGYPYTTADIATDLHYSARKMIQTITRPNGKRSKCLACFPDSAPRQVG